MLKIGEASTNNNGYQESKSNKIWLSKNKTLQPNNVSSSNK